MHAAEPEFAHRDIDLALGQQRVFDDLHRNAWRFAVQAHAVLMEHLVHRSVMSFGQQVGDRAAEIPKEAIAHVGAADHSTGQYRQIGPWVVSPALRELLDHVVRPVLHAGFPTIHHHVSKALAEERAEMLPNRVHVAVEIVLDVLGIELVHLQTCSAGRARGTIEPTSE